MSKKPVKLTETQQAARVAILLDVVRRGGEASWHRLHSRGHHFKQVLACENRGDLKYLGAYEWAITEAGRLAIQDYS